DEHVTLGRERLRRWLVADPGMSLARDADVTHGPQELAAHAFAQARERSSREIEPAGFERRLEAREIERHDLQPHVRRLLLERVEQRRELPDHARIDAREAERARGHGRMEGHVSGPQRRELIEDLADRPAEL